jgi:hypothetical protein
MQPESIKKITVVFKTRLDVGKHAVSLRGRKAGSLGLQRHPGYVY